MREAFARGVGHPDTFNAILADDDRILARWRGSATALDGLPYVNEYAWVMTMESERVTVVAYLDLASLDELLTRVN
ncbi:hypothetical protein [Mycolicibacterium baixiangningiae]|uniref:hypothetical protein n=1 Tax=Mycolicibacterium baixiangningiae TaxID=2761578 RepID=UPI0018D02490|nr:hypothetical protein [Mycolicibacterium baixiangningiae]